MKQAADSMREANIGEAAAKKALAHVDINRVVAQAMKQAEIAMQKAEAAQAQAARRQVTIEHRVTKDDDGNVTDVMTHDEQ
jgi:hypothetical protein